MLRKRLSRKPAAQAALLLPLALGLAGCNSKLYHPLGSSPADTVTFPAASTQGWLQQYGTGYVPAGSSAFENNPNGDTTSGVATDFQGNVIVLDETLGAFPGFTSNNLPEFAVVKFDGSGNRLWTQQFGTGSGDFPNAIATDAQGNIFVAGATTGAFSGFTNSAGTQQSVVIKLNPSGQTVWIQQFPSTGSSQANGLAVDAQGNVVVAGETEQAGFSDGYTEGGYVAKLSGATGSVIWNQAYNATSFNYETTGVSVDSQGNVIAVGGFPGPGSSTSTTYMVAKLDGATGNTVWQQLPVTYSPFGGQMLTYTQVAVDAQGDVLLGGVDDSAGYSQCVIASLANATGAQQWKQEFGAAETCIPGNLATDTADNVLLTGNMFHPFFSASNPSKLDDVFLAKLNASGTGVWLQQFGTGEDLANGSTTFGALTFVATDSQNHAYVAGTTKGAFSGFTNTNSANELFVTQFGP
ncbi:MAG: SBBP repeat-containing protein [Acidobacteriaceae bacterium]